VPVIVVMMSFFRLALLAPAVAATRTAHLQGSKANALATPIEDFTGVKVAFEMFAVHAPTQAAAGKAPAADAQNQPVGVQVDEKLMDQLHKDLSPECGKRYTAMMKGDGPQMHNFDQHGKDAKGDQCQKELKGSECGTIATVTEAQTVPDGRKLSSKTTVEGMSCLPKECTSQKDLSVLAAFMHGQTKEIFPDERIKVDLHVDCAASGGAVVDQPPKAVAPAPKSGASALLGVMAPLLALLFSLFA